MKVRGPVTGLRITVLPVTIVEPAFSREANFIRKAVVTGKLDR
jgi:hypothetical protein